MSALLHPSRSHPAAEEYRRRVAGRPIVISFVVVTELRYGALKAGWENCGLGDWSATSAGLRSRSPTRTDEALCGTAQRM